MWKVGIAVVSLSVSAMAGCQSQPAEPEFQTVPLSTLYSANRCGATSPDPDLLLLNNEETFIQWEKRSHRHQVGYVPKLYQQVNFKEAAALVIEMGQKTTGGYDIDLAETSGKLQDGVLSLSVALDVPEPGRMLTQAITSPCVVVAFANENVQAVEVLDESGDLFAQKRF